MLALGLSVVGLSTTARIVAEALVLGFHGREALAHIFEDLEHRDIRIRGLDGRGAGGRLAETVVALQGFNGRIDLLVDGGIGGYGELGEVVVDQSFIGFDLGRDGRVGAAVEASAFGRLLLELVLGSADAVGFDEVGLEVGPRLVGSDLGLPLNYGFVEIIVLFDLEGDIDHHLGLTRGDPVLHELFEGLLRILEKRLEGFISVKIDWSISLGDQFLHIKAVHDFTVRLKMVHQFQWSY